MILQDFLYNKQGQDRALGEHSCVLFFEDIFCHEYFLPEEKKNDCQKIKQEFKAEKLKTYQELGKEYYFYKISKLQ